MSKLIVIRGNSGSGKGTVAKMLRGENQNIAIVEQDYLRRFVLKEKENEGVNNIDLIKQVVEFALVRNYDVILEGILVFHRYGTMLQELKEKYTDHHFFYLDVSLEETLRRHATKINAHEFGEKEIRKWYTPKDITNFAGEIIIPENSSAEETVRLIKQNSGL